MAKWGEGDPRWIVEERPDATNVNNWHWTEKNAAQWSKDKLKELLLAIEVDNSSVGKCSITEVTSIEGEAVANNRKGKLIFFYEWVITCAWSGSVNGKDEKYTGKLEIPNLSEENAADEITADISVESTDKEADALREMMRKQGTEKIQNACAEYIRALRNEFAKDMIKPTKLPNGGDNSINSFTTDAQQKEKARQHAQEIKKPTVSIQAQQPKAGVKIETSSLNLCENFKCTAEEFYRVLTNQDMLQAFTANRANVNASNGGRFELLDGNIQGKFVQLSSPNLIKQEWRIRNWPAEHYSNVTINIEQKEDTTQVSIEQTGIPSLELERTREGWKRYYFESIKRTFGFGATMF